MSDMGGGFGPPPMQGASTAASLASAAHAAHEHRRLHTAENMAEWKAMHPSRLAGLRRLLNRVTRRG